MGFADEVAAFEKKRPPCGTGEWIATLDPRDATAFSSFLERGGTIVDLWRLAVKHGCEVGQTQFRRHCRRDCSCYPRREAAA
ncbi:hypothetical protein IU449_27205 [Nocardia higoensis]|uniref:Uncharacterized protein n=1 Tax=Nocardia higoensis TaxID=228599 RepID=A0ABS0DIE3_9NOCA|nr:hypothetical protein [Nocardia higoensis]MBF6358189.1 hypothetical protein [Nocardia higoensis]